MDDRSLASSLSFQREREAFNPMRGEGCGEHGDTHGWVHKYKVIASTSR